MRRLPRPRLPHQPMAKPWAHREAAQVFVPPPTQPHSCGRPIDGHTLVVVGEEICRHHRGVGRQAPQGYGLPALSGASDSDNVHGCIPTGTHVHHVHSGLVPFRVLSRHWLRRTFCCHPKSCLGDSSSVGESCCSWASAAAAAGSTGGSSTGSRRSG